MDEELEKLLQRKNAGENIVGRKSSDELSVAGAGGGMIHPPGSQFANVKTGGEMELTPELARTVPVVNRSRKQNKLMGITNFFNNPETQNALLQFGRAFANNDPREAGTILADAGEAMLEKRGTAAATAAFESGENIAEAGGKFANADIVAGLQSRRQQAEEQAARLGLDREQFVEQQRQFNESIDMEKVNQQWGQYTDNQKLLLESAAQDLNADQFKDRLDLMEQEQALQERLGDSLIAWREAQAEALGPDGGGANSENLALRTNEYLQILGETETVAQRKVQTFEDELEKYNDLTMNEKGEVTLKPGFWSGVANPLDKAFGVSGERKEKFKELAKAKKDAETELANLQTQRQILQNAQQGRLTGKAPADNAGDGADTDPTNPNNSAGGSNRRGTKDDPIPVDDVMQGINLEPGQYMKSAGSLFRISEDGVPILVKE